MLRGRYCSVRRSAVRRARYGRFSRAVSYMHLIGNQKSTKVRHGCLWHYHYWPLLPEGLDMAGTHQDHLPPYCWPRLAETSRDEYQNNWEPSMKSTSASCQTVRLMALQICPVVHNHTRRRPGSQRQILAAISHHTPLCSRRHGFSVHHTPFASAHPAR